MPAVGTTLTLYCGTAGCGSAGDLNARPSRDRGKLEEEQFSCDELRCLIGYRGLFPIFGSIFARLADHVKRQRGTPQDTQCGIGQRVHSHGVHIALKQRFEKASDSFKADLRAYRHSQPHVLAAFSQHLLL